MDKDIKNIEKYKKLVSYFTRLSKQSDMPFLAETSKQFVVDFVSKLAKYEKKERTVYEKMIEQVGGDKTKFVYDVKEAPQNENIVVEEPKVDENVVTDSQVSLDDKESEFISYVTNNVFNDENLKIELGRLEEKLAEDLKNSNAELIEVWVRNYKDFVVRNNLNKDYMVQYMVSIFKKYDKNNDYVNDVEELFESIDLEELVEDKQDVIEDEKNNENTVVEKPTSTVETVENKENSEEVKDSTEIKENSEDLKYNSTETRTSDDVDKTASINGANESLSTEPIKIVSTKKSFFNRTEKLGLGVAAIACLSTPFITPAVLVAYMIYKLRKNHKYKNKELEQFLEDNNFTIDTDSGKLRQQTGVDEKGKPVYSDVSEQSVGKAQYEAIKKELIQMGALKSKFIPEEYKKNKFLQILMGLNPVRRIKSIKDKYKKNREEVDSTPDYFEKKDKKQSLWSLAKEDIKDFSEEIKSGMRRF